VQFACDACGHPAVTLPDALYDDAIVCCQSCQAPIATWAVFKQRTTQAILAAKRAAGASMETLSPDPLDQALLTKQRISHSGLGSNT
jgi:hypothetical protein